MSLQPAVDVPSKSTSKSDFTELGDGKIPCILNTEDTEIPCNDDIFLLIHPSTSFGSRTQPTTTDFMNASAAAAHAKNTEPAIGWSTKATDSSRPFEFSQKVGIHGLPELNYVQPFVGPTAKTESYNSRSQVLPGFVDKTIGESIKNRSFYAIPKLSTNRLLGKEVSRVDLKGCDNSTTTNTVMGPREAGYGRTSIQEPALGSSALDHDKFEMDDDVPFFSDVEAMILDMDLDPYDQDSHTMKVPSYQYDETKRTIIRLEQGAHSCLQRAMTSRGALAIFYDRHLRHYIRKPEAFVGRSTEDIDVDVDLRREGRANKISRRQAIIKMEADGSFFLKNLGKSSVSVNGMTIGTGQLVNLSPCCLIEINGMSFVFEINQGYVGKHLGNFCLRNKGRMGKSVWSAEDES